MKIVMLTPYWLATKGGITTYVYNLAEELKKIDEIDVIIITSDEGSDAIKITGNKLAFLLKLPFILRKVMPDVIHCHELEVMLLGALLYRILFNHKVKTIYTFHTQPSQLHEVIFLNKKKVNQKPWWKMKLFSFALKKCDLITCVSKVLGEEIISFTNLPIRDFVVTPVGVREKSISEKEVEGFRNNYNLGSSFPVICTIGVLELDWKVKGIELLLKAFAETVAHYHNAKLLVVGDGRFRKFLEGLAEQLEIQSNVVFTGNLDNPFIALSTADIYCQLGLSEFLGIATLEAMVCGKPVLVTKAGEIPKTVEHGNNGMLVEPNVQDVVNNLIKLVENPDMAKRLGENARISVSEKFAWPNISKQFMELYETLLSSNPSK